MAIFNCYVSSPEGNRLNSHVCVAVFVSKNHENRRMLRAVAPGFPETRYMSGLTVGMLEPWSHRAGGL